MNIKDEDFLDMFQECFCEYLAKIENYNPSKGTFSTYIYPSLIETIKKSNFREVPISVQRDNKKVKCIKEFYSEVYNRVPTISELSEETGLTPKRMKKLEDYNNFFYK